MTPSREDYIKFIYGQNQKKIKVTNKKIAEELKISPPSVTEMLNKLVEANQIIKDGTLGYTLTQEGTRIAQTLIRKHRLWEVFLVNYLGYDWEDVHADAEVLEHATSDYLSERLNEFLQYPEYCPHGSIIFGNTEETKETIFKLSEINLHESVVIAEVVDDRVFLEYLSHKNISVGDVITLVAISNYDATRTLKVDDRLVEISNQAAEEIFIRKM